MNLEKEKISGKFNFLVCLTMITVFFWTGKAGGASGDLPDKSRGIQVIAFDLASGSKKEVSLYSRSYAVIIGIDKYRDLKYDKQLSYAVRDAKGVEEVLRKNFKFDKIITIYNEEATKDNIMKVLSGDLSKISKEDSVFVFWAGHGYTETTEQGDLLGYLLTFDGTFEKSELYKNISMTMIKEDISKRIPAKHIFYVMDACYSGLLVAKRGGAERKSQRDFGYLQEITKENVRQVLSAGSKDQEVLDGGPRGHSVFTGRFIEALENTEDFITAFEISALVKEKVFSDARTRNYTQTPKYGELSGLGDYVFVPSLEQKVEDTKLKVSELQKEMVRLEALEKAAAKAKDERINRRVYLEKRVVKAKLKAEQLRQQALEEDRKRREREEQERLQREQEHLQREQEKRQQLAARKKREEKQLAMLTERVQKKRKTIGVSSLSSLSIESAISEIQEIDNQINEIRENFSKDLADSIKQIDMHFSEKYSWLKKKLEKLYQKLAQAKPDEFETIEEVQERIKDEIRSVNKEIQKYEMIQNAELLDLENKMEKEYQKQINPLLETLEKLFGHEFTLTANDLVLEISRYDPYSNTFTVAIKATQPILKQEVMSTAKIAIPRQDARQFKRHFENDLLRAVITGHVTQKNVFRTTRAYIIDDADNKQYNLFSQKSKSEYNVERKYAKLIGPLYYDANTSLEWLAGSNSDTTWDEAKSWVENLSWDGGGWRMPTLKELRGLYQRGEGNRNMTPLLKETSTWFVWSGETRGSSSARGVFLLRGRDSYYNRSDSGNSRAFAVRSRNRRDYDNEKKAPKGATKRIAGEETYPTGLDFKKARLSHRSHQRLLLSRFYGNKEKACRVCHHKKKKGRSPKACKKCHKGKKVISKGGEDMQSFVQTRKGELLSMKDVYHAVCKGCHIADNKKNQVKKAPVVCNGCHVDSSGISAIIQG